MANDDLDKSLLLLNNAIAQLTQEQASQKEQALKLLDNAIEQLNKEQANQKAKALKLLDNAIKKLSKQQLSQKEKILKVLDDAIKKLSSTEYNRPKESIFRRLYNSFIRPKQQAEETSTPTRPYFFDDFSMQEDLSPNHDISDHQASPRITIEIDLGDIEKDAIYGIALAFDEGEDTDTDTDTDTSSDLNTRTDITLPPTISPPPISPPPVILNSTPITSIPHTPSHPLIPDNNTPNSSTQDRATNHRDSTPPPIINTVLPTNTPTPSSIPSSIPTPAAPHVDNNAPDNRSPAARTQIPTTQTIASSSVTSNFLPPYLQRQKQQDKVGNKTINISLIEYLHNKEVKKSNKFNNTLNNNQQLHEAKYSTGEGSQVSKFNENAANIYKNVKVSEIATTSQQFFEVSNNHDSKVKVSLVEKPNISKLMIQSQSDNSVDLMLSITMETKKQLGPKANMKIYMDENTDDRYIQELIKLLAKSISLGLNIQLLPPKNNPYPEKYTSIIASVIHNAHATAPKIDSRLLPTPPSSRR